MTSIPSTDEIHAAIRLRTSISHLTRQLRALSGPEGPGAAKLGVLGQLYRLGALSPTRLAQCERVKLQTLTRLLAELESEGLIRRKSHPSDARQTLLSISRAGVRVLSADIHRREASLASIIAVEFDAVERIALLDACRLIDRVSEALAVAHVGKRGVAERSESAA